MVPRMRIWISTLALTLFGARAAHAQCTMDTDCKGDRVCVEGTCQTPEPVIVVGEKEPAPAEAPKGERKSPGVFGTGIALTVTGGLALTAGTVFLVLGIGGRDQGGMIMGGAIAAGSGTLILPAGIIMTVVGGERQPLEKKVGETASMIEEAPGATMTFAPWVVPTGGGATVVGTF